MKRVALRVRRREETFPLDISRVVIKPFMAGGPDRWRNVINRVLKLTEADVEEALEELKLNFANRHKNIWESFQEHFEQVRQFLPPEERLSVNKQLLIGAYFTHEFSLEAAAFFNPSIVPHPDQSGLQPGDLRFIMSFRATGEGHISSIEFRSGVLKNDHAIAFDPVSRYVGRADTVKNPKYFTLNFTRRLDEMGWKNGVSETILAWFADEFTFAELETAISRYRDQCENGQATTEETIDNMLWLARSNYEIRFRCEDSLSERAIFPVSDNESRGIEDARFVRFVDDDGVATYYATCTAYNGFSILPQLLVTQDFLHFRMMTLTGESSKDKGMALFPRKINGRFVMTSRIDGENMYIMTSDDVHFWDNAICLQMSLDPWEFVQTGNCGSPIETSEGWLLLTHGVGPMRQYCIGAVLLDLADPSQVIGKLKEPLLVSNQAEREGYVPNVVYSCGSLIHNGELILPYAMSDQASTIAMVGVDELLDRLKS